MKSQNWQRLLSSFIVKLVVPAALCSLATYLMLGYAKPHMLPRMRLFFSAIWIGIVVLMGALGAVLALCAKVLELVSGKQSRSR